MVYVDTSVLVPLFLHEPHSSAVAGWYAAETRALVAAAWCVPEFAGALALKQRTGALDMAQAQAAWDRFERLVAADLRLVGVEATHFHRAATLVRDAAGGLRAGDALHLACAEAAGARQIATLDAVMARSARRLAIDPVAWPQPA